MSRNKEFKIDDDATRFVLAGIAYDVYCHVAKKDIVRAANLLQKVPEVIAENPGFLERFRKEQERILRECSRN